MGQKIKYQYSYFIHPFVIKENKYQKYLLKLLKDKNVQLKIFRKEKDLMSIQYFLQRIQEFLFSSFGLSEAKMKKLEELPLETKSAILADIHVQFLSIIYHEMYMEKQMKIVYFLKYVN